jgi:hypothetical protein
MIGIFTSQQPREDTNRTRPPLGAVHSSMAAAPQRLHASKLAAASINAGVNGPEHRRCFTRGAARRASCRKLVALACHTASRARRFRSVGGHVAIGDGLVVCGFGCEKSGVQSVQAAAPPSSPLLSAAGDGGWCCFCFTGLAAACDACAQTHAGSPAVTARQAHSGTHVVTSPLHRARPGVRCACYARLTGSIYPYSADTRLTFTEERTMCLTCSIAASALRLL